ncbi:hypothetical protein BHE90_002992 [Fusarium euwallaceae]|uniref:Enoyl-CoA hydratase n=1 Tax=Fusarium euwallaceae TaxID=1147111 RepID=A0A430M3D6_9HYPO|nr:hypothetical protein BHE90_002992 [Fusarium euwallaceae]
MASSTSPNSYSSLSFKDISVSYVPADSPTVTKVLVVALNRPTKYNAVTENLLNELEAVYNLVNSDERVRAVVLTGNGKAFCAGADLEVGFGGLLAHKKSPEAFDKFRDQGGRVALLIAKCIKPTIVAINGPAAGVGLTITLPATIRVAWSDAKVGLPFSRRGLTLESCSAFFLPKLIGLSNATHLTTTGSTYLASDPLVSGLFSKLLPTPQETVSYAVKLAADIAENTSLASTKLMRDMMLYCPSTPEETHILDSKIFLHSVGTKDNVEGIKSFMQKRKPEFSGTVNPDEFPSWPWWDTAEEDEKKVKGAKL